jgi:hypothetical protein
VKRSILLLGAALAVFFSVPRVAHSMTKVTACGQAIDGPAELAADLDCSAYAGDAVVLHNGPLYLRGHTLIGAFEPDYAYAGVECERPNRPPLEPLAGRCKVIGPGEIREASAGVRGAYVSVRKAIIADNVLGIVGNKLRVKDVELTGNTRMAVSGYGRVKKSSFLRTTVTNNASGIIFWSCLGCGGPSGLRIRDSTITGNEGNGVFASPKSFFLVGSSVTGNAADPQSPGCQEEWALAYPHGCADIQAFDRPRLYGGSTCGTSYDPTTGGTWGVCSND